MKALLEREAVRWAVPALALLVVFVLYAAVAAVVVVTSGGPVAMAAAQSGTAGSDDVDEDDDALADDDVDDPDDPETPQVTPTPVVPVAGAPAVRCEELFSSSVVSAANSAGYVLNPSWSVGARPGPYELEDAALSERQMSLPSLDCRWLNASRDTGTGIRSVLSVVTRDDALWLDTRFAALGYQSQDELGGTRYFFESKSGGVSYGESHMVIGGIWFSTHWIGYGPKGYTADMVGNYLS